MAAAAASGTVEIEYQFPNPSETSLRNDNWVPKSVEDLKTLSKPLFLEERGRATHEAHKAGVFMQGKDGVTKQPVYNTSAIAMYAIYDLMNRLLERINLLVEIGETGAKYHETLKDPLEDIDIYTVGPYVVTKDYLFSQAPSLSALHNLYKELKDTDESMQGGKRRKQKRRSSKKSSRSKKSRKFSRKH